MEGNKYRSQKDFKLFRMSIITLLDIVPGGLSILNVESPISQHAHCLNFSVFVLGR